MAKRRRDIVLTRNNDVVIALCPPGSLTIPSVSDSTLLSSARRPAHFNIAMAAKIFIVEDDIFKSISLYAKGFLLIQISSETVPKHW